SGPLSALPVRAKVQSRVAAVASTNLRYLCGSLIVGISRSRRDQELGRWSWRVFRRSERSPARDHHPAVRKRRHGRPPSAPARRPADTTVNSRWAALERKDRGERSHSGSGSSKQGGTTAQHKAAGRKGGKATARKH